MIDENKMTYLTNIPQDIEKFGFCKTLLVRKEVIHIKHIMTEIFTRKSIDLEYLLNKVNISLFEYMNYITNRMRKVHHFKRSFSADFDKLVKCKYNSLFKMLDLYNDLNLRLVLDFDGVLTKPYFQKLYRDYLYKKCKIIVCSANPNITDEWFTKRDLPLPEQIFSMSGKVRKMKKLVEINKKYDILFYVDNEKSYLDFAWIFGIHTYLFKRNKIEKHTLKTK